ncbi:MAG: hypothetical protein K9K76_11665, partial [Halanaerobiales bacterium]|nr:hypothetical protein [Halanaerobiales bacterium]
MKEININIKTKPINYNIIFTDNIIENLSSNLKGYKVCVITDQNVNELYAEDFFEKLKKEQKAAYKFVVKPGEEAKSLKRLENIYELLIDKDFNRDDYIISQGGGVIGDLAGLAASTYKRG